MKSPATALGMTVVAAAMICGAALLAPGVAGEPSAAQAAVTAAASSWTSNVVAWFAILGGAAMVLFSLRTDRLPSLQLR